MTTRIIRMNEIERLTGLSKRTIYRKEGSGDFPERIHLGPNAVGWYEHEIQEWIESLRLKGKGAFL